TADTHRARAYVDGRGLKTSCSTSRRSVPTSVTHAVAAAMEASWKRLMRVVRPASAFTRKQKSRIACVDESTGLGSLRPGTGASDALGQYRTPLGLRPTVLGGKNARQAPFPFPQPTALHPPPAPTTSPPAPSPCSPTPPAPTTSPPAPRRSTPTPPAPATSQVAPRRFSRTPPATATSPPASRRSTPTPPATTTSPPASRRFTRTPAATS